MDGFACGCEDSSSVGRQARGRRGRCRPSHEPLPHAAGGTLLVAGVTKKPEDQPILEIWTPGEAAWVGISHPPESLAKLEGSLGYRFPIVGGFYYTFDTDWTKAADDRLAAAGRELMITWSPETSADTLQLAHIPAGRYDRHIDQMLEGMRAFDGPVIVRWGHEPNGNWYSWASANPAGQKPAEYVAAWRYIVGRERKLPGKSNIRWFWCPNAIDVRSAAGVPYPMEQYWPGDEWVDLVGCDGFNEPKRGPPSKPSSDVLTSESPRSRKSRSGSGRPAAMNRSQASKATKATGSQTCCIPRPSPTCTSSATSTTTPQQPDAPTGGSTPYPPRSPASCSRSRPFRPGCQSGR